MQAPADILILEDHPMMVSSVQACLHSICPQASIVVADSLAQARALVAQRGIPHLVIVDLGLPDSTGLDTLSEVKAMAPQATLMVFSAAEDSAMARDAKQMGAICVVPKSGMAISFVNEIRRCMAGCNSLSASVKTRPHENGAEAAFQSLSKRQHSVLALLAEGLSNREIALQLDISEKTVHSHLAEIYQRLSVQNRTQASARYLAWAHENGVVS